MYTYYTCIFPLYNIYTCYICDSILSLQQETVDRAREHVRDERDGHAPHNNNDNSADIVQCPVCLGPINYPVDTNCGHRFCAQCVLAYWHADRWPRACRCPVCRREVTLLLSDPIFERNELFQNLSRQVIDYNQRMSGQWRPVSVLI